VHGASPIAVAAIVWGAAAVAIAVVGAAIARSLGAMVVAACNGTSTDSLDASVVASVMSYAMPVVVAAAIAGVIAQLGQTRALWLPRRRLADAPAPERSALAHAIVELGGAAVIGTVVVAWLWLIAPRLARLFELPAAVHVFELPAAATLLLASFVATLAIALVAIGAVDAIVRHLELAAGLRMTAAEQREDLRQAGLDPRWRRRAGRDELTGATLLVLGDGVAVAIAWDPHRRPVPARVATGRDADATRLLGLARRDRVPVHRDPALASALAGIGPVDEAAWPRLAEIVAAVTRAAGSTGRSGAR
jgi:flagellar biosynthesis protein FlhB